jgi:hypothetical protein
LINPHSAVRTLVNLLWDPELQPRCQRPARAHDRRICLSQLLPSSRVAEDALGDTGQRVARSSDVDCGAIIMAEGAAWPRGLRVNDGQTIVDALYSIDGARDLYRAIMCIVARNDASQRDVLSLRFHGESPNADAAALERANDP